jgi:hypothetical protein
MHRSTLLGFCLGIALGLVAIQTGRSSYNSAPATANTPSPAQPYANGLYTGP